MLHNLVSIRGSVPALRDSFFRGSNDHLGIIFRSIFGPQIINLGLSSRGNRLDQLAFGH
jgi:hypothetical protein